MFLSLKTLYRKRTVIWPFYFYTIIRTLSTFSLSIRYFYVMAKIIPDEIPNIINTLFLYFYLLIYSS
ncbi:hypothetical protein DQU93_06370 [Staphylococcus aureus]|nr:hypothetical protein DQU93_06370 [Staphylococcus aureus]